MMSNKKNYGGLSFLVLVFTLVSGFSYSFGWEFRPTVTAFGPSEFSIMRSEKEVEAEKIRETDPIWQAGANVTFKADFLPIRYGFGLAYRAEQKDDNTQIIPATLPVWGVLSFGIHDKDAWMSPYVASQFGFIAPLTTTGAWWEKPINFLGNIGIGAIFPYGLGLELSYDYSTILKSFEYKNTELRLSCGRIALSFSWGIQFGLERSYNQHQNSTDLDE